MLPKGLSLSATLATFVVLLSLPARASAQGSLTAADIQRLQDSVLAASSDVASVRARDRDLAARLQDELDDLRDEVVYLRVKLRREGSVSWAEYGDLRDRIDALRARAVGPAETKPAEPARQAPAEAPRPSAGQTATAPHTLPVGQEIDVRLQVPLSSETAQVEDRFTATTMVDVIENGRVLVPAGSVVRGFVSTVDKAGRVDRKGSLNLAFDQITVSGRSYPLRATVTQALESEGVRGEAGKIGAGGAIGGIIGGIIGGLKGALAGILIGAGGVVAATPGEDVKLPAGTVLRLRLDSALEIAAK